MTIEKRLLNLKNKISDAGKKREQAEGKLQTYKEQLKSKFGCSTVKQAKTKLNKLDGKIEENELELDAKLNKLEKKVQEAECEQQN